ncbi:glycosyltransferase [bacterium]|nr:MAG: glycosyltransferase [bacterium]
MSAPTVGLCLLTFNELEGCRRDVPLLPRGEFDEVFCVDGGSKDGTGDYLKGLGIPVHVQPKRGLNAAYVHAARVAKTDALVVFFPKGTVPVSIVSDIRKALLAGPDLVAASRNMAGGRNEEDADVVRPRKWFVQVLGALVALLWRREGAYLTDILHGIKGFRVEAFKAMRVEEEGHSVDLCMAARSYKLRQSRTEVPAVESPRFYGETHFKALAGGTHLLGYLAREVLGANPGQAG